MKWWILVFVDGFVKLSQGIVGDVLLYNEDVLKILVRPELQLKTNNCVFIYL